MSFEGIVANKLLGDGRLEDAIERMIAAIERQIRFQPFPVNFLKSARNNLSSNVADDVEILKGPPVPRNHRGTLKDFNVNFSSAAGTVKLVVYDSELNIRQEVIRDITSSTNGFGGAVLEEGESMAIVGQTAGAGTFGVFVSGELQRMRDD